MGLSLQGVRSDCASLAWLVAVEVPGSEEGRLKGEPFELMLVATVVNPQEQITLVEVSPLEAASLANAEVWLLEDPWMVARWEATGPRAVSGAFAVELRQQD